MSRYIVMLSFGQIVALVDIDSNYSKDDSPRFDHRTQEALHRRELISADAKRLTKKGKAYLTMAMHEYAKASGLYKEARARRTGAVKKVA